MSSFFDSLNFNHASGSGRGTTTTTTTTAPRPAPIAPTPRKRRSIARPTPTSPELSVYWDCPPSSLMGEWGKTLVEVANAKRRRGDESTDDRSTWRRQDSHASTSSTTSTSSTRRLKRRPTTCTPSSTFKRHASSFAALGGGTDDSQEKPELNPNAGVQKLLADLSIRVQEIERLVEQEQDEDGEGDVTIGAESSGRTPRRGNGSSMGGTPHHSGRASDAPHHSGRAGNTPHHSGHATASSSRNTPSQRTLWDRSVTFPPTGSPRVSKGPVEEAEGDDSFDDVDFDEEFLRDIELSQQGALISGMSGTSYSMATTIQGQGGLMDHADSTAAPSPPLASSPLLGKRTRPHSPDRSAVQASTLYAASSRNHCQPAPSSPPSVRHIVDVDGEGQSGGQGKVSQIDAHAATTGRTDSTTDTRSKSGSATSTTTPDLATTTVSPEPSRSHSPVKTTAAPPPARPGTRSTTLPARTRSAGLPRQTQQSRHPLAATTRNARPAATTKAAFKPPSRVVPISHADTDFDAMLDDEDDPELERALAAAGY